jgi:hypothetical protein
MTEERRCEHCPTLVTPDRRLCAGCLVTRLRQRFAAGVVDAIENCPGPKASDLPITGFVERSDRTSGVFHARGRWIESIRRRESLRTRRWDA